MEDLTNESFKEKVFNYAENNEWSFNGDKPAIIDFNADWCVPCKTLTPILKELAKEYEGKIDIYSVNTESAGELAMAFQIQSIPSMLFIPMNEEPQMAVGLLPKENLIKVIEDVLKIK